MARLFDLVIRSVWRGWLKTATLRRVKFDDLITQNQLLLSFCIGLLGTLFFSAAHFWLSWLTAMSIASIFRPSTRVFVGLSTGLLMGAFHFQGFSAAPLNPSCYTKPVHFSGEVTDFPKRLMGKSGEPLTLLTLDLRTISADRHCGTLKKVSAQLVASEEQKRISPGDVLEGHARLNQPDYRWITGGLPRNVRNLSAGIDGQLAIHSIDGRQDGVGTFVSTKRAFLAETIDANATSKRAARHLQALLLGRQNELEEGDWLNLRTFGMTHAFVVSGLHLGLVALWCHYLVSGVSRVLNLPASFTLRLLMALGVCGVSFFYVGLTGASLPAERALLMGAIGVLARITLWAVEPLAAVLLTGAILLSVNPFSGLSSGFWLSLILTGVILGHVSRPVASRLYGWLSLHVLIAAVSSVLTVLFFSQVTWMAFFSNVLLVPALTLISLPFGLIGITLLGFDLEIGRQALFISSWSVDTLLKVMDYAGLQVGDRVLQAIWLHPGALCIAIIALLASQCRGATRVWLSCSVFLSLESVSPNDSALRVHIADVGQGTAIVITSGEAVMLYDTGGETFTGRPVVAQGLIRWLKQNGMGKIDLLIVSHGDADHAGGLFELFPHFSIGSHYGFSGEPCIAGKRIQFGRGVEVHFLSGTGQLVESRNNDSCVIALTVFNTTVLLPGDISRAREFDLLAYWGFEKPLDLLIAAHHGSNTSSGAHFIDHASPTDVVFTSRYGHQFGHPHQAVTDRFEKRSVRQWDTGIQAGISFKIAPNGDLSGTAMRHHLTPYWASGPPAN